MTVCVVRRCVASTGTFILVFSSVLVVLTTAAGAIPPGLTSTDFFAVADPDPALFKRKF